MVKPVIFLIMFFVDISLDQFKGDYATSCHRFNDMMPAFADNAGNLNNV